MTYKDALKIKIGDILSIRKTDRVITVVDIEIDKERKDVFVRGDTRVLYHHGILVLK